MEKAIQFGLLFFYFAFPFYMRLGNNNTNKRNHVRLLRGYTKSMFVSVGLVLLICILAPESYRPLDFSIIGKGILINDDILFYCFLAVGTPFLVELLPFKKLRQSTPTEETHLFGEDTRFLPKTNKEFVVYVVFTIVVVVFEEFIFRKFAFYILNKTLYLKGDVILLISSLMFTIGHEYKKIVQLLFIFILGLVLGKVFQHTGSLLYPVLIHLSLNLTQVVMVFRKIKRGNQIS